MTHATDLNDSYYRPEWLMLQTRMTHATDLNDSCYKPTWLRLQTWMTHATNLHDSCYRPEWLMLQTWMTHDTDLNDLWYRSAWLMIQNWMTNDTYLNEFFLDNLPAALLAGHLADQPDDPLLLLLLLVVPGPHLLLVGSVHVHALLLIVQDHAVHLLGHLQTWGVQKCLTQHPLQCLFIKFYFLHNFPVFSILGTSLRSFFKVDAAETSRRKWKLYCFFAFPFAATAETYKMSDIV